MLQPGTSALFMIVEKITTDNAVEALSKYGGTVLKSSLPHDAERQIQEALHGARVDTTSVSKRARCSTATSRHWQTLGVEPGSSWPFDHPRATSAEPRNSAVSLRRWSRRSSGARSEPRRSSLVR
jgi:hypothetical protein